MSGSTAASLRNKLDFCSTFSERSGEEPAGSAWAVKRHLLFELPLPWPSYFMEARSAPPELIPYMEKVYAERHYTEVPGIIAFAPDDHYSIPGKYRILHYWQQEDQVAGPYEVESFEVEPEQMFAALRVLIDGLADSTLDPFRIPHDPRTRDFFVCTHGTVDACCATFGAPIYKLMRAMADQAETPVRVWRATHFGGHRFAPTALDLPTGHYWGRLKADTLAGLVHRNRPAENYRPLFRGSTSLPSEVWQRAEAELFNDAGWAWFDTRFSRVEGEVDPEQGGTISFSFEHPEAGSGEVDIFLAPNGFIETRGATDSPEIYAAPQFIATKTREEPAGILARIAACSFSGES